MLYILAEETFYSAIFAEKMGTPLTSVSKGRELIHKMTEEKGLQL